MPNYSKAFEWVKLISITGGGQILIQGIGLISGIIIIRLLPTKEYALYTLANTMLGTMTLVADSGISSGVMAQGGKVWQQKEELGIVLVTGLDLRKKLGLASVFITSPVLIYLLLHQGASWIIALLITLALVPAFFAGLSDSLYELIPKLHQDIKPLQKNQVMVSIIRLVLTCLTLFAFPFTFIAILAAGVPRIYGNIRLKKISYMHAEKNATPSIEIRKKILQMVKRILPGSVYYSFSGQITIWIISIFGHTESIAQIGALGRLSTVLSLFGVIFGTILVPRFARLPDNTNILFKKFLQINILAIIVFSFITLIFWNFSDLLLSILGNHYRGLNKELVLNIIGSCISLIAGISFSLYTCRGWAIQPFILIPIDIIAIILGVYLFDVETVKGVLYYNIFLSLSLMLINGFFILLKIGQIDKAKIILN